MIMYLVSGDIINHKLKLGCCDSGSKINFKIVIHPFLSSCLSPGHINLINYVIRNYCGVLLENTKCDTKIGLDDVVHICFSSYFHTLLGTIIKKLVLNCICFKGHSKMCSLITQRQFVQTLFGFASNLLQLSG